MDPVESFLTKGQKFSLSVLISVHSRLSVVQLQKGSLLQEDILQNLRTAGPHLNSIDINAYAALIFESIITPALTTTGHIKLQISKDIIANDKNFIVSILNVMYSKCSGPDHSIVEEFKHEAVNFLKNTSDMTKPCATRPEEPRFEGFSGLASDFVSERCAAKPVSSIEQELLPEEHKMLPSRVEFEKSEPIVRLLAQVRKVGMDILFPQSTHDKILACIYVAIKSFSTPAHRELIDMVMAVKDSNRISHLESVSKTKVRGVLALLKHGELLITQGDYGEPVRLFLAYGIETFQDLRSRHDAFLNMYMLEHHLFIPTVLKSELVWQLDENTRSLRLRAMDRLIHKLTFFFSGSFDNTSAANNNNCSNELTMLDEDEQVSAYPAVSKTMPPHGSVLVRSNSGNSAIVNGGTVSNNRVNPEYHISPSNNMPHCHQYPQNSYNNSNNRFPPTTNGNRYTYQHQTLQPHHAPMQQQQAIYHRNQQQADNQHYYCQANGSNSRLSSPPYSMLSAGASPRGGGSTSTTTTTTSSSPRMMIAANSSGTGRSSISSNSSSNSYYQQQQQLYHHHLSGSSSPVCNSSSSYYDRYPSTAPTGQLQQHQHRSQMSYKPPQQQQQQIQQHFNTTSLEEQHHKHLSTGSSSQFLHQQLQPQDYSPRAVDSSSQYGVVAAVDTTSSSSNYQTLFLVPPNQVERNDVDDDLIYNATSTAEAVRSYSSGNNTNQRVSVGGATTTNTSVIMGAAGPRSGGSMLIVPPSPPTSSMTTTSSPSTAAAALPASNINNNDSNNSSSLSTLFFSSSMSNHPSRNGSDDNGVNNSNQSVVSNGGSSSVYTIDQLHQQQHFNRSASSSISCNSSHNQLEGASQLFSRNNSNKITSPSSSPTTLLKQQQSGIEDDYTCYLNKIKNEPWQPALPSDISDISPLSATASVITVTNATTNNNLTSGATTTRAEGSSYYNRAFYHDNSGIDDGFAAPTHRDDDTVLLHVVTPTGSKNVNSGHHQSSSNNTSLFRREDLICNNNNSTYEEVKQQQQHIDDFSSMSLQEYFGKMGGNGSKTISNMATAVDASVSEFLPSFSANIVKDNRAYLLNDGGLSSNRDERISSLVASQSLPLRSTEDCQQQQQQQQQWFPSSASSSDEPEVIEWA